MNSFLDIQNEVKVEQIEKRILKALGTNKPPKNVKFNIMKGK